MATTGIRTETDSATTKQPAPRRQARPDAPTERHPLGLRIADSEPLRVGMALTRQQLERNALSDACKEIRKPAVIEMQLGRHYAIENLVAQQVAADRERLQQITAGISATQQINPLREAERELQEQLKAILHPCRGLLEGLRMQTSGLKQVAEVSSASLRLVAEACSPRLPSLDIDLGLDAIRALGTVGDFSALGDLHGPVRIHAVPRLPNPATPCPGRCREALPDGAPFSSSQEALERAPGLLDTGLESKNSQKLLEELIRFQRSDEIPSDAREGMSVLTAWWKLNRLRITPDQSLEFNRTVHGFIGAQLGLTTAPDRHHQLKSGLLVPWDESREQLPAVELEPRIYTSLELSKILNYNDSTIRRQAETAWTKAGGLGPCPLRKASNWYVVEAAEDGGGKNRGWKFQKRVTPENS